MEISVFLKKRIDQRYHGGTFIACMQFSRKRPVVSNDGVSLK